jgi:hypothetical protein
MMPPCAITSRSSGVYTTSMPLSTLKPRVLSWSASVPSAVAVMPVADTPSDASVVGLTGFCLLSVVPATAAVTVAAALLRMRPPRICVLVTEPSCVSECRRTTPGPLVPSFSWATVMAVLMATPRFLSL